MGSPMVNENVKACSSCGVRWAERGAHLCLKCSPPPRPIGEVLRTWKVETTASGVTLWINGKAFLLGSSGDSMAFDIAHAAQGLNGIYEGSR